MIGEGSEGDKKYKAAVFAAGSEEKRLAMQEMIERLGRGERVVVGTNEPMWKGRAIGDALMGKRIVVKRRATREEYLAACPGEIGNQRSSAPFYWELEAVEL